MKRWIFVLLFALLLTGCAETATTQTVNIWGEVFTVDKQNSTVSDGEYTYLYTASGDSIRITYPDGSWYLQSGKNIITSSWSDDYDGTPFSPYAAGEKLVEAIKQTTEKKEIPARNLISGIVLLTLGLIYAIWPGLGLMLRYSLWVKDAEPTEFALKFGRVAGICFIIIGIVMFFAW